MPQGETPSTATQRRTDPASDPAEAVPRPPRRTRMVSHLATLGPFALIFPVYSVLLDHLPTGWFGADWVRYLFAGLAALCCGLALRVLLQKLTSREPAPIATPPIPRPRTPVRTASTTQSAHAVFEGARQRLLADFRTTQRGQEQLAGPTRRSRPTGECRSMTFSSRRSGSSEPRREWSAPSPIITCVWRNC